jgi:hypothetical protein
MPDHFLGLRILVSLNAILCIYRGICLMLTTMKSSPGKTDLSALLFDFSIEPLDCRSR